MAKSRKKTKGKSGGLLFKLFIAALIALLLWAAGRFEIKGRTPYEHADAAMHVRFLQPVYDSLVGEVSDVADDAIEALPDAVELKSDDRGGNEKNEAAVPAAVKNPPPKDETPLDNITEEDRKALDDLIEKKSTKKIKR